MTTATNQQGLAVTKAERAAVQPKPEPEPLDATTTIEQYRVLDSPPAPDLQSLVEFTAQICEVPSAAINLVTGTEQYSIATHNFDHRVCARDDSMCAAVMSEPGAVVVSDASRDPRFETNPFVSGVLGAVRFYASAALVASNGLTVGRLCIFDEEPRELKPLQEAALVTLAQRVMDILELRFRSRQLEDSLLELTRTRDELERSNEHLTLFAEQVSHDLRTPLTAIQINAELMATEPVVEEDPLLPELLDNIIGSARRMNQMIEQVLTFAKEGGGVREERVPLSEVFARATADLDRSGPGEGASIVVEDLPTVTGDADLLYVVALNLLTNALKFSRPGVPPVVRVSGDETDGRAVVRVEDNGIGVPPELREEAFVLFKRGRTGAAGDGIGLATTKRVVEAHRGRIAIDPSPQVGTTVVFELPLG